MSTTRMPLVLGLAATAVVAGGWLLLAAPGQPATPEPDGPTGSVLSPADRDALAAVPVDPGAAPGRPDPSVDFADPVAVARAYVVAGYSLAGSDAGHTNRAATPYAAPNTPPGTVGVLVLTPPPPGHRAVAAVTDVTQVGGEPTDTRRGYLVGYRVTSDGAEASPGQRRTRYLMLARQFDGRWLVADDTAEAQVGEP
ncbi:MAG: hypothetical protein J2P19_14020 [Pseudonocardia sp.]|nr:hypothetical protein [Pseudonocardia sp.]